MRALFPRRPIALGAAALVVGLLLRRGRPRPELDERPRWEPAALARLAAWQPARAETRLGQGASALWASPMTLLGLAAAATTGVPPRLTDDGFLVTGARGPVGALLRRRGFSATTLGHVVIATGVPSARLLAHERVHIRQAERLGPLFGPAYLTLLAVYGYRRHPMERAARLDAAGRDAA